MQGAGADIIKLAMLATTARLAADGLAADLLLTVHDELVFETTPALAEQVGAVVKAEMEGAYALDVPLDVDVGIAASWADC
jgi:DNA polymerase-1